MGEIKNLTVTNIAGLNAEFLIWLRDHAGISRNVISKAKHVSLEMREDGTMLIYTYTREEKDVSSHTRTIEGGTNEAGASKNQTGRSIQGGESERVS